MNGYTLRRGLLIGGLLVPVLIACGGGGGSEGPGAVFSTAPPPPPTPPPARPTPTISEFQSWCRGTVGDNYPIRDGVSASIAEVQFIAATIDQNFDSCRQFGVLTRPATTRVAKFEVVTPEHWNGRLVFLGGGGFDGRVFQRSWSPGVIAHGFATVATDMGHQWLEDENHALWALNDAAAIADFAFDAIPDVREAAVSALCSSTPDGQSCRLERVYFEGCSNGGRSALLAAQRAPALFDGVIARAPVLSFPALAVAAHSYAKRLAVQSLSQAKLDTIDSAQYAACTTEGGTRLLRCPFDAATLRCSARDRDDCLTDAELATLATVRSPVSLPFQQRDGIAEHPALPVAQIGDRLAWPLWLLGAPPADPEPWLFVLQRDFFRYFVAKAPTLDTLSIDPADYADELAQLSAQLDATSTDLSEFARAGGKLILWHGAADAGINPMATIDYFERLEGAVAADPASPTLEEFARLYIAPDVMHCAGGYAADEVDLLTVLDAWREGTKPGLIIAHSKYTSAGSRPLCEWPAYLYYHGNGDHGAGNTQSAANYGCAMP